MLQNQQISVTHYTSIGGGAGRGLIAGGVMLVFIGVMLALMMMMSFEAPQFYRNAETMAGWMLM